MYKSIKRKQSSSNGWTSVGSRVCTSEKKKEQRLDEDHLKLVEEVKNQAKARQFLEESPDIAPTFSRQTTGEVKCEDMCRNSTPAVGFEVASVDLNQTYTNSLQGWMELPWERVLELQVGTWVQYTNTTYPDYVNRKKVLCLVGNGILAPDTMECDGERTMFFWTILQDQKEAEKKGLPIKEEWYACSRGRHDPVIPENDTRNGALMACRQCSSRGWVMTPGKVHQDRRFYVNHFARFIVRR